MLTNRLPLDLAELVLRFLPPLRRVGPKGGRPPIDHVTALKVIWWVLKSGCRWRDVPSEMGCSGETARKRLVAWERLGVWDMVHHALLAAMKQAGQLPQSLVIIDSVIVRAHGGGEKTGPSPVDRRKPGITSFTPSWCGTGSTTTRGRFIPTRSRCLQRHRGRSFRKHPQRRPLR